MDQTSLRSPAPTPRTHLPDAVWEEIAAQYEDGVPTAMLAEHYGVDDSTINKRMRRMDRGRRGPGVLRLEGVAPVASIEEARTAAIAGLLNAFNDNRLGDLLVFAKVAVVLDRLDRTTGKSAAAAAADGDRGTDPPFTPLADIIELMAFHGVTGDAVEADPSLWSRMLDTVDPATGLARPGSTLAPA